MNEYNEKLKVIISRHLKDFRNKRGWSQDAMSEQLRIVPRSYIELEHGTSLCSTRVLVSFLLLCGPEESSALLDEIKRIFSKMGGNGDAVA